MEDKENQKDQKSEDNLLFEQYESMMTLNETKIKSTIQKINKSFQIKKKKLEKEGKVQSNFQEEEIKWAISEKVHGSNFSFLIDVKSRKIQCATRKQPLQNDQSFYNFQEVLERLQPAILKLNSICETKYGQDLKQIQVYGELFGGKYEHPEIQPVENQKKVQWEVQYSPKNEFLAFDLKLYLVNEKQEIEQKYVTFQEALELFQESGLDCVKVIETGSVEKLFEFDVESFQSQIYELYKLPKLENSNLAEGVVIRPYNRGHSPIVKKKAHGFLEQAKVPKNIQRVENKKAKKEDEEMVAILVSYICKNRLLNLFSKYPEEEYKQGKNREKFENLLEEDSLNDFLKEDQKNNKWYDYVYLESEEQKIDLNGHDQYKNELKQQILVNIKSQIKAIFDDYFGVSQLTQN